ncbi:hypothetical protein [Flavobacterium sp. AG291]|uniref:hypothetical protein n=1 Tax=Flavobacterium sp. AG291 TaxID=2184000 RepID=UPI000E0AF758|nr:hypothetical protein [Flavobacterium sp. AG291]RDI16083.1 hypothetical protein DEU42_101386 [Flavobacterium sp. AG291]
MSKIILIFGGITFVIAYPFFVIKYFETKPALLMISHYWLIPTTILITIFFPILYFKKLKGDQSGKSKIRRINESFWSILVGGLCSIALINAVIYSIIITTNTWVINPTKEHIKTPVIEYKTGVTSKGRRTYDIKFVQQNDTISLGVRRPYRVGEVFTKTMNRGRWGFLYSKE